MADRTTPHALTMCALNDMAESLAAIADQQAQIISLLTDIRDNDAATTATTATGAKGRRTTALLGTIIS